MFEIILDEEKDTLKFVFSELNPIDYSEPWEEYLGHGIFLTCAKSELTGKKEMVSAKIPNLKTLFLPLLAKMDVLWELEYEWLENSGLPLAAVEHIAKLRAEEKVMWGPRRKN